MARINVDSRILNNVRNEDIPAMLNMLIDKELAKSTGDVNTELVNACVDALITLEQEQNDRFNALIPLMSGDKFLKTITNQAGKV